MELIDQHTKRIMEGCKTRARAAGLQFEDCGHPLHRLHPHVGKAHAVGVQVDEARGHDVAGGVDRFRTLDDRESCVCVNKNGFIRSDGFYLFKRH